MSFLDADYSAIEARIVCWLAGETSAIAEYRAGVDRYKRMASAIYNIPEEQVNKYPQRFIGKQAILLSGFQGGPGAFRRGCEKFGYKDLPMGMEETCINTFRARHPRIKQYWPAVEKAAKRAITKPGEMVLLTPQDAPQIGFCVRVVGGIPFLLIRLPSGRKLAYPRPRLIPSKKFEGQTSIVFLGRIGQSTQWGDVDTYGGKLVENITQAVAADIMANGAHNAEREGYRIATLIHDQALAFLQRGQTAERFVELLTDLPTWADGLPVEAEGAIVPFYKKG